MNTPPQSKWFRDAPGGSTGTSGSTSTSGGRGRTAPDPFHRNCGGKFGFVCQEMC